MIVANLHFISIACRYDYNLKIFYFCDIKPQTDQMQCYKYVTNTKKVCCAVADTKP